MAEPSESDLAEAMRIVKEGSSRDYPYEYIADEIAQAIAAARADGAAEWPKTAELHEITEAACKRATAEGLDITIRVKERRAPKKKDQPDGK